MDDNIFFARLGNLINVLLAAFLFYNGRGGCYMRQFGWNQDVAGTSIIDPGVWTRRRPLRIGPDRWESRDLKRSYRLSYCRYHWRERTHRTRPLESHSTVIRREDLYLYRNLTALERFSTPPSTAGRSCYISCQPSTSVHSIWTNE